jgi:hypothetical protein
LHTLCAAHRRSAPCCLILFVPSRCPVLMPRVAYPCAPCYSFSFLSTPASVFHLHSVVLTSHFDAATLRLPQPTLIQAQHLRGVRSMLGCLWTPSSTSRSAPPSTCTSARLSRTLSPLSRASDGSSELYDYAAEERDFQAQTASAKAHKLPTWPCTSVAACRRTARHVAQRSWIWNSRMVSFRRWEEVETETKEGGWCVVPPVLTHVLFRVSTCFL